MLAHHMEDLKETTHKIHYERFRFDKLREMMGGPRDYRVSQQQKRQIFCFMENGECLYFQVNGADIDDEYR